MKANEYFKMLGYESVKYEVENQSTALCHIFGTDFFNDLKRLVESWELVEFYGGLDEAKLLHYDEFILDKSYNNLQQAIKDVESCQ